MGFGWRVRTVMALHSERGGDESDHKKLRRMMNDVHKIQEKRNRVVHDPWFYNPATDVRARYAAITTKDGKPVFEFVPVQINEPTDLARRISAFDDKAWQTLDAILQPLREKNPGWFGIARFK